MTVVATDEAEGAQALFCYIADILGDDATKNEFAPYIDEGKTATDFFTQYKDIIDRAYNMNHVDTGKSKEVILNYIENDRDWFVSSLKIAEKIITKVEMIDSDFSNIKGVGWDNLYYAHGDKNVMKVMSDLYKSANNQSKKQPGAVGKYFGNINKWSPADIYFASDKAKDTLMKLKNEDQTKLNNLTFAVLNESVADLLDSGDLLPLSLKKAMRDVVIKKVNFDVDKREKLLAETFCEGVKPWTKMVGKYKATAKSFKWTTTPPYKGGRDILLLIESGGQKGTIQMRATPASSGKPSAGIKIILKYDRSSALGGQVASIPLFQRIVDTVDKSFGKKLSDNWDTNYKTFKKAADAYIEFGGGAALYLKGKKDSKAQKQFNDDIGAISALTMMNPFRDEITAYFKNPGEAQNNIMRALFAYVSSRTPFSAKFVIAKD